MKLFYVFFGGYETYLKNSTIIRLYNCLRKEFWKRTFNFSRIPLKETRIRKIQEIESSKFENCYFILISIMASANHVHLHNKESLSLH